MKNSVDLSNWLNSIDDAAGQTEKEKWLNQLFEQYKLYVEMADRMGQRRALANTYFLSINSALLAFVGFLSTNSTSEFSWAVAFAGMANSFLWNRLVVSYYRLSSAKFRIIHYLEGRLPYSLFDAEWAILRRDPWAHESLSSIERRVPLVFLAMYAFVFLRSFHWCWLAVFRLPSWPGCSF